MQYGETPLNVSPYISDDNQLPLQRSNVKEHAVTLQGTGLKATLPRLKILEFFRTQGMRHASAEDVHHAFIAAKLDIGLSTIYRVLSQFERAGLLQRTYFDGGKAVYELRDEAHHDHLVCLDCGRIEEFCDNEIETRQKEIAAMRGFAIVEHALSLYAHCDKMDCPHHPVTRQAT